MGILDGIVEWIAEQVMAGLDLVTTSVLGALGCDMAVFLRYFPAAETMYSVFVLWQSGSSCSTGSGSYSKTSVLAQVWKQKTR